MSSELVNNVRVSNLFSMLRVLMSTELQSVGYVRRRFEENGTHFDDTLAFLVHCDLVEASDCGIRMSSRFAQEDMIYDRFVRVLMQRMTRRGCPVRDAVLNYLRRFQVSGLRPVYRPTVEERGLQSGIRNLLMELGVISYHSTSDQYILSREHNPYYVLAARRTAPTHPDELQRIRASQSDIGHAAEIAVVSFERDRVGVNYADHVIHIAHGDVAAGYDVESITVSECHEMIPRMIEVKAVRLHDYRFYWTANEIAMASALRCWYHLYLVPVTVSGHVCIDKMRIVDDPFHAVLEGDGEWLVGRNVCECCLRDSSNSKGFSSL